MKGNDGILAENTKQKTSSDLLDNITRQCYSLLLLLLTIFTLRRRNWFQAHFCNVYGTGIKQY